MEQSMIQHDYTTIGSTYVCTILAIALIAIRLICRYRRREKLWEFADDIWMAVSIIPLVLRLGVSHVFLMDGTNAVPPTEKILGKEEQMRILGSKMVLAGRIFYAAFLWCMKACILAFLSRLMSPYSISKTKIRCTEWFFALSFLGIVLSTLLECRPFKGYYQINPSPSKHCTEAYGQLYTFGISNIATDLILIALPLPHIVKSRLPLSRKIQVGFLFCVGFIDIAITLIRMPIILNSAAIQDARSFWASVEIFVACLVANAPILNNFIREYRKRQSFRRGEDEERCVTGNSPKKSGGGNIPGIVMMESALTTRVGRSEEELNVQEQERFVIAASTNITQSVCHVPGGVVKNQQTSAYYKGDFLGTQIWTDQEAATPKISNTPPRARGNSGSSAFDVERNSTIPLRQTIEQHSQGKKGSYSGNITSNDLIDSLPKIPLAAVIANSERSSMPLGEFNLDNKSNWHTEKDQDISKESIISEGKCESRRRNSLALEPLGYCSYVAENDYIEDIAMDESRAMDSDQSVTSLRREHREEGVISGNSPPRSRSRDHSNSKE